MQRTARTRSEAIRREALAPAVWFNAVPVRFGHCDPAGIVFTPRYFDMLNETVERFFIEGLGFDYYGMLIERRVGLGYVQAACEFRRPSRMGDLLEIAVLVERIGQASYTLSLPIFRDGAEVARGLFITAPTLLDEARSCPIPDDLRSVLETYRERCSESVAVA